MNRKRLGLLLLGVTLLPLHALASIGIDISADRTRYIKYEHVNITLTLRNDTGNTLDFRSQEGGGTTTFFMHVQDGSGRMAQQRRNPSALIDDLVLPPGSSKSITFSLNNFYNMLQQTDYFVYAQIGHPRMTHDYRSPRIRVEVRKGFPVWGKKFGLPSADQDEMITNRTASLLRFNDREREVYCLQIEDDNFVYVVHRIAQHITGARPRGEIDAMSNIHIFLRIKSRIFMHQVYDYNGTLKQEKYYTFSEDSPTLRRDQQTGSIRIIGGREAIRGIDYFLPDDVEGTLLEDTAPTLEPL